MSVGAKITPELTPAEGDVCLFDNARCFLVADETHKRWGTCVSYTGLAMSVSPIIDRHHSYDHMGVDLHTYPSGQVFLTAEGVLIRVPLASSLVRIY